jgi:hypothetical protein
MAKLLRLSRPSKAVSNAVRTWWAMRCQKQRRARDAGSQPAAPAPVITDGVCVWRGGSPDVGDAELTFTFADPGLPVGLFDVYAERRGIEQSFSLVATCPSTERSIEVSGIFTEQIIIAFEIRYRNGSVVGPFSAEFEVDGLKG